MNAFVFTTFGGRRFHDDSNCEALEAGRGLSWNRYEVRVRRPEEAARAGYTACRVCVPPALALPATGETHGHEPWFVCLPDFRKGYGCARCRVRVRVLNMSRYDDPDDVTGWHHETHAVPWPCTSAVVLGLVPRGGAL